MIVMPAKGGGGLSSSTLPSPGLMLAFPGK
jgi:hypothetical protein